MSLFGPSRDQIEREFFRKLGALDITEFMMSLDFELELEAVNRGKMLFEFLTNIDEVTWEDLLIVYRRWLARTGRLPEDFTQEGDADYFNLDSFYWDDKYEEDY